MVGLIIAEAPGIVSTSPTTVSIGTLLVDAPIPNRAPVVISSPRSNINMGTPYFYQVQAADLDGDNLTYSLTQQPVGMVLDSNGLISWTPNATQLGNFNVTVNVNDGVLSTQQTWTISTLTTANGVPNQLVNRAPVVTSVPSLVTNVDDAYEYQLAAIDPDNDILYWSLESGPIGMVLDAARLDSAQNDGLFQFR